MNAVALVITATLRVKKKKKREGERTVVLADFTSVSLARTVTYAPSSGQETLRNCKQEFS